LVYFYCTCKEGNKESRSVKEGRTPYRLIKSEENGICSYCGHYAVASKKIMTHSNELYYYLMGVKRKERVGNVKGGLSIKNQKQLIKNRNRR